MRKQLLALILAILAAFGGVSSAGAMGKIPDAETDQGSKLKTCELKVEGMTCGGCERTVKKVLSKEDGFAGAEVSHKKGNAVVRYDPAKTSPEKLAELVTQETGYKASVLETQP